jgi:hypothetical protein
MASINIQSSLCYSRMDVDESAFAAFVLELDEAGNFGKQGVIFSQANIQSGLKPRPALADQDRATRNQLSSKAFDAQSLGIGIAPVSGTSHSLFMSHTSSLKSYAILMASTFTAE